MQMKENLHSDCGLSWTRAQSKLSESRRVLEASFPFAISFTLLFDLILWTYTFLKLIFSCQQSFTPITGENTEIEYYPKTAIELFTCVDSVRSVPFKTSLSKCYYNLRWAILFCFKAVIPIQIVHCLMHHPESILQTSNTAE